MKRWRLAKGIWLPEYKVKIEEGSLTDTDAEWNVGTAGGVIRLRKGMNPMEQRYHIAHEMLHAVVDWLHEQILKGARP